MEYNYQSNNSPEPPFEEMYKRLFLGGPNSKAPPAAVTAAVEERELPLIDLGRLAPTRGREERERCERDVAEASREWGFFQVVNHGIPLAILEEMRREQVKVFREPFEEKKRDRCMSMSLAPGSYRWGTPTATCLGQLSWSEAFHIPLTEIFAECGAYIDDDDDDDYNHDHHDDVTKLSSTVRQFATTVSELAHTLANILAEKLGNEQATFLEETCLPNNCYLRMNRYPPCPKYSHMFGLMPLTDSDFLTILYQDQVGGLQLVKDGKWIAVKPNPEALIVNIGDLFQAWSNGVYKSVEHRVVASESGEVFHSILPMSIIRCCH